MKDLIKMLQQVLRAFAKRQARKRILLDAKTKSDLEDLNALSFRVDLKRAHVCGETGVVRFFYHNRTQVKLRDRNVVVTKPMDLIICQEDLCKNLSKDKWGINGFETFLEKHHKEKHQAKLN